MTTSALGPGSLLGDRYRLGVLLADVAGARFWRATDTVLVRDVGLHVVDVADPRSDRLLEAARAAAAVVEPHLLRVLDCDTTTDDSGGYGWTVSEWGEGFSMDHLLARGKLSPGRAAWVAREVAAAIAHVHDEDVPHGYLNPEAVLVTHTGEVKLIGFAIDAVVHGPPRIDPRFGDLSPREADVIDLAGLLYAGMVGKWPGVTPSAVPAAPYDGKRVLRARQVRAGIPRTLDAICERVLGKEACEHVLPIETALEISAALTDFVGDADAPEIPSDGPVGAAPEPPAVPGPETTGTRLAAFTARARANGRPGRRARITPHETVVRSTGPAHADRTTAPDAADPAARGGAHAAAVEPATQARRPVGSASGPASGPAIKPSIGPTVDTGLHLTNVAGADPDATQAADVADLADLAGPAPAEPAPPPPPFEDVPAKPLFASEAPRAGFVSSPEGPAVQSLAAEPLPPEPPRGPNTGEHQHAYWPFTEEEEAASPREDPDAASPRNWWGLAAALVGVLILIVAMIVAFNRGHDSNDSAPARLQSSSTSATPTPALGPVVPIVDVSDFDPQGDPQSENPGTASRASDDSPTTAWTTSVYRGDHQFNGNKTGVGLLLDLGSSRQVGSVRLLLGGGTTGVRIYVAQQGVDTPPQDLSGLSELASDAHAGADVTLRTTRPASTRYVVVWLTSLPRTDRGFRGEVREVTVRS